MDFPKSMFLQTELKQKNFELGNSKSRKHWDMEFPQSMILYPQ